MSVRLHPASCKGPSICDLRTSSTRERKSLNGLWQFRLDPEGEGRSAGWFSGPLPDSRDMAVPASFDDFAADATVRDYFGDIWYQTSVWVPQGWQGRRIVLDFESATHRATVWVNYVEVMSHEGGYTPFEADVTDHVNCRAAQPGGMVAPADQTLLIFDLRLHVPVPR